MEFDQYLEYLGLSKAEFAREIGVTPDTVSRWRGDPPKLVMKFLECAYMSDEVRRAEDYFRGHPEELVFHYRTRVEGTVGGVI